MVSGDPFLPPFLRRDSFRLKGTPTSGPRAPSVLVQARPGSPGVLQRGGPDPPRGPAPAAAKLVTSDGKKGQMPFHRINEALGQRGFPEGCLSPVSDRVAQDRPGRACDRTACQLLRTAGHLASHTSFPDS